MTALLLLIFAYLIGSFPTGLVVGRLAGLGDIRNTGSGNIGATNMLRAGGKKLAAITLVIDMVKGLLPVLFARLLLNEAWVMEQDSVLSHHALAALVGLAAVCGHVFSVWLKFRGGKGVATTLGALLAISFPAGFMTIALWIAVFAWKRYSSLAALVSIAASPVLLGFWADMASAIIGIFIACIVVVRHHENIVRLLAGTESKSSFGSKQA